MHPSANVPDAEQFLVNACNSWLRSLCLQVQAYPGPNGMMYPFQFAMSAPMTMQGSGMVPISMTPGGVHILLTESNLRQMC